MKKLSLLMALILCVTIGGVYATWNYARNVVDSKQASATVVVTGTQSSTKGTIAITAAPKRVVIDDTDSNHIAELFFGDIDESSQPVSCNQLGTISVVFTPAATGVDEDVKNNGICLEWTLTATDVGTFGGQPIFVITQASGKFNNGAPTKTASVNIGDYIELNGDIVLDTYAKYQAFELAIKNITFTLTVSESAPVVTP